MILGVARCQGKYRNIGVWVEIYHLGEVALVPEEGHSVRKCSATCALVRFPILLGLCPVLGAEESDSSVRYIVRVGNSECVYFSLIVLNLPLYCAHHHVIGA